MTEDVDRAFEVASLIESWLAKERRAEMLRLKAELEPPAPTSSDLVAEFDRQYMETPHVRFDRDTYEELEARRSATANAALARRNKRAAETHQVAPEQERPWWRR